MKIKEFAELCNTTKKTLFLYEEKGLLSPVSIKENGYREYDANQAYTMELISILQNAGFSLSEIKGIIANNNDISKSLNETITLLNNKISSLENMKNYIIEKQNLSSQTEEGYQELTFNYDKEKSNLKSYSFLTLNTYDGFIFENSDNISIFKKKTDGEFHIQGSFYVFHTCLEDNDNELYHKIIVELSQKKITNTGYIFVENIPRYFNKDNKRHYKVTAFIK